MPNIGRGVGKGVNHIGIAEIDLVDLAESADTLHIAYKIASMQIIYPAVRINACGRGMSLDKYKVLDTEEFPDGYKSFTKQLKIKSSKCISYQVHRHCDEVWTFIDGEEELVFDGIRSEVGRGRYGSGQKRYSICLRAISDLTLIEVQSGDLLVESDIEHFEWIWNDR